MMKNTNGLSNEAITHNGLPPRRNVIKKIQDKYNGFLFVGDPHLTCISPGSRVEDNDEFLTVVLNKLLQAREIAEKNNLFIIFLGDITNNATAKKDGTTKVVENTNLLLSGFAKAMNFRPCLTLPGNHDKEEISLTDSTTLSAMHNLRLIDVIEPSGAYGVFTINGKTVGIGGTPHGEAIPTDVRGLFGKTPDHVVWITHSLFNFDNKIPGLMDPPEIIGCDMMVNGHDHTTQKPRQMGKTLCFNPGNITRMSKDRAQHIPSVWQWDPSNGIKQHTLQHNALAFDVVGNQVDADIKGAFKAEKEKSSLFASLISVEGNGDLPKSGSADMIEEDIDKLILKNKTSPAAALIIKNLHKRAPEKMKPS
jgi:predicted phosphodiesterase